MAYYPAHCPNKNCRYSIEPGISVTRIGFFQLKRNKQWVRRYRCKHCRKSFSSRTFSTSYRHKKPYLNEKIFALLCSGNTHRGIARILKISRATVQFKLLWLSQLSQIQHQKMLKTLNSKTILFDEMESIEHTKLKPLSIGLMVNTDYQILATKAFRIPAKGYLSKISLRKYGPRPNETHASLTEMFQYLNKVISPERIRTDEKPHYTTWMKTYFKDSVHERYKRRHEKRYHEKERLFDPLFELNQRCAKLRADMRRLTRRSWCTTKKIENLQHHLNIYTAYNNRYALKFV